VAGASLVRIVRLRHRVFRDHAPHRAHSDPGSGRYVSLRMPSATQTLDLMSEQQGDHLPRLLSSLTAHAHVHHASGSSFERPDFPELGRPDFPEPSGGAQQVYRYLGRYTHRIAISNARILGASPDAVTFRTRGDQVATLPPLAFLRRFLQHVLPPGFVKIRHYGLLASGNVTSRLEQARALLGKSDNHVADHEADDDGPDQSWHELLAVLTGDDIWLCPSCGQHALQRLPLPSCPQPLARAPPETAA
jgi:hypothetical protein